MPIGKLQFDLSGAQWLRLRRGPVAPASADVSAAVADALEHPLDYPPLRRALTPDDHVAVLVDESLPDLSHFLSPLLDHLRRAHITPDGVTLLCTEARAARPW